MACNDIGSSALKPATAQVSAGYSHARDLYPAGEQPAASKMRSLVSVFPDYPDVSAVLPLSPDISVFVGW